MLETIYYKKKGVKLDLEECGFFGKVRGLMFRRLGNAPILSFSWKEDTNVSLHSLFVFFPFIVIFLDDKNNILEMREIFPWNLAIESKKKFSRIIEIPVSQKHRRLIEHLSSLSRKV